jgi:hypothetical protein
VYKEVGVLNIWGNKISNGAGVLKIWGKKIGASLAAKKFATHPLHQ